MHKTVCLTVIGDLSMIICPKRFYRNLLQGRTGRLKSREWTSRHEEAGVDNAGVENAESANGTIQTR